MNKLTSVPLVAVVATLVGVGSLVSSMITTGSRASAAPGSMSSTMPLTSEWRACDFSKLPNVVPVGDAHSVAHVGADGSGMMVATVDMATALPNTRYDVRVIQTPRPSLGCAPGAPGVLTGLIQTDGVGSGSTTIGGPVKDGATGAWVLVERPSDSSQTPAEFYTTKFIASI